MGLVKTFPDRYISKLATIIMLDEEINKMLYYKDVLDEDIYSLPLVKNPILELNNKQVFINRRVQELFKQENESNIYVFINLYSDAPCSFRNGKSRFIDTLRLDIGVICADACRNTVNGARENIVFDRIVQLLREDDRLQGIGEPVISQTKQNYQIPYGWNAYIVTVTVNYFNSW